jgi:hypothetical protein
MFVVTVEMRSVDEYRRSGGFRPSLRQTGHALKLQHEAQRYDYVEFETEGRKRAQERGVKFGRKPKLTAH